MVDVRETVLQAVVIGVAIDLCIGQKSTTTRGVKEYIRSAYPKLWITQQEVSDIMKGYSDPGSGDTQLFTFTDNGMYRTYTMLPDTKQVIESYSPIQTQTVTRSMAASILTKNQLQVKEAVWVKKDNTQRTLNDFTSQGLDPLGYVVAITSKGERKRVDPRKIISVTVGNIKMVVN
jgi:hypothetical protein